MLRNYDKPLITLFPEHYISSQVMPRFYSPYDKCHFSGVIS